MADRTSSSVVVAAPRADVMAVIADFAVYPEWASGVRSAEVIERDGDGMARQVRFRLDAGMFSDTYVLGYHWDDDTGVSWDLAEPGSVISGMTGAYVLADQGGATEVTYELAVEVRIPLPGILKRKAEKAIIDAALNGLRTRAEARGGEGT